MRTTKRENKYSLVNLLIYLFIYKFAKWQVKIQIQNDITPPLVQTT